MRETQHYHQVKAIFLRVVDLTPEERDAAFDEVCRDDPAVAAEIRELIAMSEAPTGWLRPSVATARSATAPRPAGEEVFEHIQERLRSWDRFTRLEPIAAGGMGVVFRAFDPRLRRVVALKFLPRAEPATAERFRLEAELQARVDHQNVLEVFETGEVDGMPYIAMRFVDGPSLLGIRGEASLEECVDLMCRVAEGVDAAHKLGLIHRDLKPGNILIETSGARGGGRFRPYVSDFGIATEGGEADEDGVIAGSPRYMAPEQLTADAVLDYRTDLYGLGAAFYELLAGRPAFPDESMVDLVVKIRCATPAPLNEVAPQVPGPLAAIVMRCLEKAPERRFASAAALARELRRWLEPRRHPLRRRSFAVVAAAAVLAIVGLWTVLGPDLSDSVLVRPATSSATFPDDPESARHYAEGLAQLRRFENLAASRHFESALTTSPEHPLVHLALSRAWLGLGDDRRAGAAARKALEHAGSLGELDRLEIEGHLAKVSADWPRAIEVFEELLRRRPDDLDNGLELADVRLRSGAPQEALAELDALRSLPAPSGQDPRIDIATAHAAADASDFEASLAAARRAHKLAAADGAPQIAGRALLLEAWAWHALGDLAAAKRVAEEGRVIGRAAGDLRQVASALTSTAIFLRLEGDTPAALDALARALPIAEQLGDRFMVSTIHNSWGVALADQGDLDGALAHYQAAREIEIELGHPVRIAILETNLGMILALRGDLSAAGQLYASALQIFRDADDRRGATAVLVKLAELSIEGGRLADAERYGRDSLEIAREIETPLRIAEALHVLGEVRLLQGRVDAAEKHFLEARAVAEEAKLPGLVAEADRGLARLAAADLERRAKDS